MQTQTHAEPNYMKIFWWLLALTLVEVGVIYLPVAKLIIAIALVLLAVMKALLVAINYMHLRFEKWTIVLVAALPIALVLVLLSGLLPDIGKVPF